MLPGLSAAMQMGAGGKRINIIGVAVQSGAATHNRINAAGNTLSGVRYNLGGAYYSQHGAFALVDEIIDGQNMVRVPAMWYRRATLSSGPNSGKEAWWVADGPAPGFVLHPAFYDAGQPIPHFYVGKYQGTADGGTKLGSFGGTPPLVSLNISQFQGRAAARNVGGQSGWMMWSYYQLAVIQMLAMIETGSTDSQAAIGQGRVNQSSAANTNAADVAQATWRGIVGLWGNVWQMVDGLRQNSGGTLEVWDRLGQRNFVATGITPPSSGWTVSVNHASGAGWDLRDIFVAQTVDGTQSNGTFADYFSRSTGERVAYVGGRWSDGSFAGLFNLFLSNAPSHSATHLGARLAKV